MAGVVTLPDLEIAPEPPPRGPVLWLRENLFSTVGSSFLSIVAILVAVAAYKGLLDFILDSTRRWDAVTYNMRLLMVQAYPSDEMWRIWSTVGIVVFLLAASLAVWKIGGLAEPRAIGATLSSTGGFIALGGILAPVSRTPQISWISLGLVLLVGGYLVRTLPGDRAKEATIPILGVVGILIAILVALLWTIEVPVPAKLLDGQVITDGAVARTIQGNQLKVLRPIASTTTLPWTIIAAVGVLTFMLTSFVGRKRELAGAKKALSVLWALAFPLLVLVLLRDPIWNLDEFLSVYLPALVVFGSLGAGLLLLVARPGRNDAAGIIGAFLVIIAFGMFFVSMPMIFRFLMLLIGLFALAGPTFGGKGAKGLVTGWLILAFVIAFFAMIIASDSGIDVPVSFFLGGLGLTIILAFSAIVLAFPLGLILALARTSTMPIFRLLSTAYIELIRGVPLITWLLIAFLMLPVALPDGIHVGSVIRAVVAMALFNAAYLAENVRGGLQSVSSGQREASKALGLTTIQETIFITLPQALRAVLPALVGQVIATFKDTSLVTIVGLFDFLHIARQIIPQQSQPFSFLGSIKETLLFAAVVYWLFTFAFSRLSLRLEKKLGVGER